MALVFRNATIFFGGMELTGQLNRVTLDYSAEALDATVFGNATRVKRGGLKDARAAGGGFWAGAATAQIDPVLYDGVGVNDSVLTLFGDTIVPGSTSTGSGFAFKVVQGRLTIGGAVGEILPFEFEALGRGVSA